MRFPKGHVLVVILTLDSGKNLLKRHETKETPKVMAILSFLHSLYLGLRRNSDDNNQAFQRRIWAGYVWVFGLGEQELTGIWKSIKVSLVTMMTDQKCTVCMEGVSTWVPVEVRERGLSQKCSYRQLLASLCRWVLGTDLLPSIRVMWFLTAEPSLQPKKLLYFYGTKGRKEGRVSLLGA